MDWLKSSFATLRSSISNSCSDEFAWASFLHEQWISWAQLRALNAPGTTPCPQDQLTQMRPHPHHLTHIPFQDTSWEWPPACPTSLNMPGNCKGEGCQPRPELCQGPLWQFNSRGGLMRVSLGSEGSVLGGKRWQEIPRAPWAVCDHLLIGAACS